MSYSYRIFWLRNIAALITVILVMSGETAYSENNTVTYKNNLVKIENPPPILADYPEFVKPLHCLSGTRCRAMSAVFENCYTHQ